MRAFLDYLCGKNASSELTRDIETNILKARERNTWRREYMTLEDSLKVERKQWLKEGRAEGREEKGFEDVERLIAEGILDETKACEVLGVDINEYRNYALKEN